MLYKLDAIAALEEQLALLPKQPRTTVTGREAVARLATTIRRLRRKGWTLRHVAQELQARGVKVKETTLRAYLQALRAKSRRPTPRPPRTVGAVSSPKLALPPVSPPPAAGPASVTTAPAAAVRPNTTVTVAPPASATPTAPLADVDAREPVATTRRGGFQLRPDREER
jgi:hypothetical protein